ncbi:hypothetical protein [Streptomyces roseus]|uniref:CNNM transmembrane domain-containing protein n=1 Tax=Streptomyces roseus TaxID=66430 RepID=A0A0J6XXV3_9ACTN|nr:hypothetical protein [Streptomyces roseus]KMO99578.1 hypothetical protein ACS04_00870 [Streptomyces roseus]
MSLAVVLLTVGLLSFAGGGAVALNLGGSATALERRGEANAELARHARGDLGPATRHMSAGLYRALCAIVAFGGLVLSLGGLLELA